MLGDGTLRGYIDELSVTGLTSNPTIFDKAICGGDAYDEQIAELRRAADSSRGALLRAGARRPARRRRPLRARPRAHRRRRRLRLARGLAAARRRHRGDDRAGRASCTPRPSATTSSSRSPAPRPGLTAIEESIFAGIPINVTLLFDDRAVPGRRRRLHEGDRAPDRGRARPRRRLGRLDLHQPLGRRGRRTRCRTSSATGSASRSASRAYRAYRELLDSRALAAAAERGRPPAAAALGEHRDQGPRRLRHPLHRGASPRRSPSTRCPSTTLLAFADHGEVGEPLPADGGDAERGAGRVRERRDRRRRAGRPPPGGGQGGLRQVLGRAAEVDRVRAREGRGADERRAGAGAARAARLEGARGPLRARSATPTCATSSPPTPSAASGWSPTAPASTSTSPRTGSPTRR